METRIGTFNGRSLLSYVPPREEGWGGKKGGSALSAKGMVGACFCFHMSELQIQMCARFIIETSRHVCYIAATQ